MFGKERADLSDTTAPYFPFVEAFNTYFTPFDEEETLVDLSGPGTILSGSRAAQIMTGERGITVWLTKPRSTEKLENPK